MAPVTTPTRRRGWDGDCRLFGPSANIGPFARYVLTKAPSGQQVIVSFNADGMEATLNGLPFARFSNAPEEGSGPRYLPDALRNHLKDELMQLVRRPLNGTYTDEGNYVFSV